MHKLRLLFKGSSCRNWSIRTSRYSCLAGVEPSTFDTNGCLTKLVKSGRIDEARKLFEQMPERDDFSWDIMVGGYADTGRLNEAREVFDASPKRSSNSWSSIVSGYCKCGNEYEGFQLFQQMQQVGCRPNQFALGSVLRICSMKGLLLRGKEIHGYVMKTRFDSNMYVMTSIIDMYAKCLSVADAEFLFKMMPGRRNHVTWTAMINGYSLNGDALKALRCFRDMRSEGVEANQYTCPGILTSCSAVSDLQFGVQVHCYIVHGGFQDNLFVQCALVDMYAKCGDLDSANIALKTMPTEHVVSWNSMILGYVKNGFAVEALSLCKEMHRRNLPLDEFTYPSIMNCLASKGYGKLGQSVHCLVLKTGFQDYNLISNALVDMYAKQGDMQFSFQLFDSMLDKDVISWTSLIGGCAYNGSHEEALKLFFEMRKSGLEPDQDVSSKILSSCAQLALLEFGQQVHANLIKTISKSSLSVDNSLLAMYANCGCLEEAEQVFHLMASRNVMTWTALICGYGQNGRGKQSLELYEEMIASGIHPDFITFIGLLFACSHAGLVDQGQLYFDTMVNRYGIAPGPDHYTCMIDLLGRAGKLQEAEKLLHEMAGPPDVTVWKAFLAACKEHGEMDLANKAASVIFELTPRDAVPYVMMSNMYSADGKWEDAAAVRKLMRSKRARKKPGYSWLEMNGKVHCFMSADRRHPCTDQIYSKIDTVIGLIKKAGYLPDMNVALRDVGEEARELELAYHSEKLAVAFGLLYAPEGAPIRIYKNIRVCRDCHSAMKFISRVFKRYIILRDPKCFHHFKDGICSCSDYY